MSCGVSRRLGSDLTLLWLWRRLVAMARIIPLAWEPPYAMDMALKRQKKKKKKKIWLPLRRGIYMMLEEDIYLKEKNNIYKDMFRKVKVSKKA